MAAPIRFRDQRPLGVQERWDQLESYVKTNDNIHRLVAAVAAELKVKKLDQITAKRLTQYVASLGMTKYFNYEKLSMVNADIVKTFVSILTESPSQVVDREFGTIEDELNTRILETSENARRSYFDSKAGLPTTKPYLETFVSPEMGNHSGNIMSMTPYNYSYMMRQGYTIDESTVELDSRYRDRSLGLETHVYRWGYSSSDFASRIGVFSTEKELSNIIALRLGKFRIPNVANAVNIYDRISVYFDNLPSSTIAREGRRYHFLCSTDNSNPNFIELTPLKEEFKFNTPIKEISYLNVSFASPLQKFSFGTDQFTATAADLNPTEFTATAHGIQSNNLIFALNYTTTSPAADIAKINEVNSDYGHSATYIDDNTFSIQVDTSAVVASGSTTIYNGNKRFWIPLTFVHLKTEEYKDM